MSKLFFVTDDCKCNGTEIISPEFLMYTTLNIPTTEFCQERLPLHLKESMMCASDNRGAKIRDSCQVRKLYTQEIPASV